MLRIHLGILMLSLAASGGAFAQTSVQTEPTKPPSAASASPSTLAQRSADDRKAAASVTPAEIITDLSRLPEPVARTRDRILAVARSGDLQKLAAMMAETMAIFSFSDEKDPIAFWKTNYPDSDGIEVLSILTTILETGFVRVDEGTQHDMYVWPYFMRRSLDELTPQQKVELFRIITGADYKDMLAFGAYTFYRLGISPDGSWRFFVAGD